jgi:hypothetical protein
MGKTQEIETLINEEALLFAQHLRGEQESWQPRVARTASAKLIDRLHNHV